MKTIDKLQHYLFNSSKTTFIFTVCAILVLRTGVWYIPNITLSASIADNPFVNTLTNPLTHYLFYNWLGAVVTWGLHATSFKAFFIFHAMCALLFYVLFIKTVFERLPEEKARIAIIFLSLLPVSGTIVFWVGLDALTLVLMMAALAYPRYSLFTLVCGVLLGLQQFEQAFFASSALLFAVVSTKTLFTKQENPLYSIKFCIMLLSGVLLGKGLLAVIFAMHDIQLNSGKVYYFKEQGKTFVKNFFLNIHPILWSSLGVGWLMVLKYAEKGRETIPFFLSLFSLILVSAIVDDETRVVALITFPLICVFWVLSENALKMISQREATICFLIGVMVPWAWVWKGVSRPSVFPYDLAVLLDKYLGLFPGLIQKVGLPF